MKNPLLINTLDKELVLGSKRLRTRSSGLIKFVAFLAWRSRKAASSWVGLSELGPILGAIHPRQVQRFLDTLNDAALPIVDFESRTRGRWRLTQSVMEVSFDLDEDALRLYFNQKQLEIVGPEIDRNWLQFNDRLLLMMGGILSFDHDFHGGELAAARNVARWCANDEVAGAHADLAAIALFRVAQCCSQESLFDEAKAALRALEGMVSQGKVHIPGLAERALLLKAKIFLNQGKIIEANSILESLNLKNCQDAFTLGRYYNMKGLLGYKKLQLAQNIEENVPSSEIIPWPQVLEILGYYRQAIIFETAVSDYQGTQSTAFNIGNLLLFAYRRRAAPDPDLVLERGIGWIAQCEIICNKFGVGGDSIWSRLALIDIALLPGVGFERMNHATGNLYKSVSKLRELAEEALAETRRMKNRLEEAEALRLLAAIVEHSDVPLAMCYLGTALDTWNELGRTDKIREIQKMIVRLGERKKRRGNHGNRRKQESRQ